MANPAAMVFSDGSRLAVGYGLDREGEALLREVVRRPQPTGAVDELITKQEEVTIVLADAGAPAGPTLQAWRGATSAFDVYLADAEPGRPPVIADHFRNALSAIPQSQRVLEPDAVADHLLFGTVPGTRTYVPAIGRVGHGECVRWMSGCTERRHFDPLIARPQEGRPSLDAIDTALIRAIRRLPVTENCVTQLSGGIDSSLLHTYLPSATPTVSGSIDSPEFGRERSYAEQASRLLGTRHEVFLAHERKFLTMLVDLIQLAGQPIRMPQPVIFQLTFQFAAASFVNGEYADVLFGLKPSLDYANAFNQRPMLNIAEVLGLARLLPPSKARGLRRRIERLRRVKAPIEDCQGLGAHYAIYTNPVLAERILGHAKVQERIERRVAYTAARFRSEERDTNPLFAHLEFGHMLSFHCSDGVSRWRQIAHARGKSLLLPFISRSVVAEALSVPRAHRYIAHGRVKYLLKDLLKRRRPTFDIDKPKVGGDLPFRRYLMNGPLTEAFDHYAITDLVDRQTAFATRAAPDWLTWNLLTLAIWRDLVLADSTLAPLSGTRVLSPPVSGAR
jgi:asparagine synthetase B (glutamine-hydrolysing)